MTITAVLAGIAVRDVDAAIAWYERLLGRPNDDRPMEILADWTDDTGTIQLVQDQERAGQSIITLTVDDLASFVTTLQTKGLQPSDVDDTTSENVLIATITDPDGNAITLVEPR